MVYGIPHFCIFLFHKKFFLICVIDIFADNNTAVVQKRSFRVAVCHHNYVHVSGGMIRAACTQIACFFSLLKGIIINVDFLDNYIVGFDDNLTIYHQIQ